MTNDLDTLLTAPYVKIDDELETGRWMGRPPQLTDSELVTLAVAQALLGFRSETRRLRYANTHPASMFPYLPQQSGYNKRLKAALPLVKKALRMLVVDTDFWFDTHWIVGSTPAPCGMSRPTVKRSELVITPTLRRTDVDENHAAKRGADHYGDSTRVELAARWMSRSCHALADEANGDNTRLRRSRSAGRVLSASHRTRASP